MASDPGTFWSDEEREVQVDETAVDDDVEIDEDGPRIDADDRAVDFDGDADAR